MCKPSYYCSNPTRTVMTVQRVGLVPGGGKAGRRRSEREGERTRAPYHARPSTCTLKLLVLVQRGGLVIMARTPSLVMISVSIGGVYLWRHQ
jgi:hypothetical protein